MREKKNDMKASSNNKLTTEKVRALVELFMEGNTTLNEESMLYDYFCNGDVDEELLPMKEYFMAMALTAFDKEDTLSQNHHAKAATTRHFGNKLLMAAASVATLFIMTLAGHNAYKNNETDLFSQKYDGSYVIIDGERNDNIEEIKPQIEQALAMAERIEQHLEAQITDKEEN